MSTTILDRPMHHCHLLEFDGRSYRFKEAAEDLARETNVELTIHCCPALGVEEYDCPTRGSLK